MNIEDLLKDLRQSIQDKKADLEQEIRREELRKRCLGLTKEKLYTLSEEELFEIIASIEFLENFNNEHIKGTTNQRPIISKEDIVKARNVIADKKELEEGGLTQRLEDAYKKIDDIYYAIENFTKKAVNSYRIRDAKEKLEILKKFESSIKESTIDFEFDEIHKLESIFEIFNKYTEEEKIQVLKIILAAQQRRKEQALKCEKERVSKILEAQQEKVVNEKEDTAKESQREFLAIEEPEELPEKVDKKEEKVKTLVSKEQYEEIKKIAVYIKAVQRKFKAKESGSEFRKNMREYYFDNSKQDITLDFIRETMEFSEFINFLAESIQYCIAQINDYDEFGSSDLEKEAMEEININYEQLKKLYSRMNFEIDMVEKVNEESSMDSEEDLIQDEQTILLYYNRDSEISEFEKSLKKIPREELNEVYDLINKLKNGKNPSGVNLGYGLKSVRTSNLCVILKVYNKHAMLFSVLPIATNTIDFEKIVSKYSNMAEVEEEINNKNLDYVKDKNRTEQFMSEFEKKFHK